MRNVAVFGQNAMICQICAPVRRSGIASHQAVHVIECIEVGPHVVVCDAREALQQVPPDVQNSELHVHACSCVRAVAGWDARPNGWCSAIAWNSSISRSRGQEPGLSAIAMFMPNEQQSSKSTVRQHGWPGGDGVLSDDGGDGGLFGIYCAHGSAGRTPRRHRQGPHCIGAPERANLHRSCLQRSSACAATTTMST